MNARLPNKRLLLADVLMIKRMLDARHAIKNPEKVHAIARARRRQYDLLFWLDNADLISKVKPRAKAGKHRSLTIETLGLRWALSN